MRGAVPPIPQHAVMAWCSVKCIGTTLPFITLYKLLVLHAFSSKS